MGDYQDMLVNLGAALAGLGGTFFAIQKAVKMWTADRGDIQKIGIDSELYTRMNAELTRLAQTNIEQEKEIAELRDKYVKLLNEFDQFKQEATLKNLQLIELTSRLQDCNERVNEYRDVVKLRKNERNEDQPKVA